MPSPGISVTGDRPWAKREVGGQRSGDQVGEVAGDVRDERAREGRRADRSTPRPPSGRRRCARPRARARRTAIPWPDSSAIEPKLDGQQHHARVVQRDHRAQLRGERVADLAARRDARIPQRLDGERVRVDRVRRVALASSARDRPDTPTASRARAAPSSPAIALSSARRNSRDRGICAPHPSGSRLADSVDRRQDDALTGEPRERPAHGSEAPSRLRRRAALPQASSSGEARRAVDEESARIVGWKCRKANRGAGAEATPMRCVLTLSRSPPKLAASSTSIFPATARACASRSPRSAGCSSRFAGAGAFGVPRALAAARTSAPRGCSSPRSAPTRSATASTARSSRPRSSRSTPTRATPAERLNDGRDYVPTNRWIVFGHHFAAIAGPGPLVGPTLAAQFGFLPGALWIIVGVVLGGAVQDFVILCASHAPQRQVARPDGEGGDRPGRRLHGARRGARHHDRADRRARRSSS